MAMVSRPYGKDRPERFIDGALTGGRGPSEDVKTYPVNRKGQSIKTSFAMDNVKLAAPMESSIEDMSWRGGEKNLAHSLTGCGAVSDEVGAAGPVKHVIIPNH